MFGEDRAFYETVSDLGFNAPLPWSQGPRRMGTDKNADVLWVANSFGSSFAKINTKRWRRHHPAARCDDADVSHHGRQQARVWGQPVDFGPHRPVRPGRERVGHVRLPVRGRRSATSRCSSGRQAHVVVPVYRTSQMGVMTVRSEAELAALKRKVN
jgi:hypothetical protein